MNETGRDGIGSSPEARRDRLAELLRKKASQSVSLHPPSYNERSLWFEHQLAPESAAYHVVLAERVRSELDVRALRRAVQALTDRHPLTRATFVAEGGAPVRRIHGSREVHVEEFDAAGLGPEALRERVIEASTQPFDLEEGPLVRVSLFRRSATEHVLLVTAHHIVVDGWSAEILLGELPVLYARDRGVSRRLPPLETTYTDYVRWQSEILSGPQGELLWSYWKEQLAGELPVLDLPTDRPRPPSRRRRGACHDFELDGALGRRLQALARAEGATLFMVLLAAFQVLLCRYGGQEDVLVGGPTAGRPRAEFAGVVGNFVNMLVFRGDLSEDPSFRTFLGHCRERVLGALAHQDYPFPLLVERRQPGRDPSRPPLFQVAFVFLRPGLGGGRPNGTRFGALPLEPFPVPRGLGQFDLTLELCETRDDLAGTLKYDADLFEAATMARLAGHLRTLLAGIVADPGRRVSQLPLLTEQERRQLAGVASAGPTDHRQSERVHRLFEAQAGRTPDAVAVTFGHEHLTYRELNARANQLGRYLQTLGVGPEALVGMYVERSLEMVVGILGILKAGGAYVPLDPAYPKERLALMLEDAAVRVVLTQARVSGALPLHGTVTVCLDSAWETIARENPENIGSDGSAENLAYVIYTSGSTGKPKGVMVTHHNVVRLFTATRAWFQFNPGDVWTLFHSYAFDFSVWELWGALLHGGRLVVVPEWTTRTPEAFYELLGREGVTVLNQTPTAFRQLIRAEESAPTPAELRLRLVIFGGEALELQSLKPWFDRHGDDRPQLVNMYGITETTVHVTYRVLTAADLVQAPGSVIGVPIPDLCIHVLDQHRQPVPVGVPGEMYVGGAGVARGYLNRPELTAERFVTVPFDAHSGSRLYRSGDLARRLSDGDLEYLGRIDHQVKIRGFRIELGEIETTLGQHPDLREVLVVAREDVPGDKRLVAYVVARSKPAPSVSQLRALLGERLPAYMVPSAFVFMDALPMTPNGKVDRRALPAPDLQRPELETAFVAPRTETERVVAAVWRKVLGVEQVGIHDDFFHLGGHSLLVAQVMARLGDAFGVTLPLRHLFEAATVADLAEKVDMAVATVEHLRAAPLTAGDEREEIEL